MTRGLLTSVVGAVLGSLLSLPLYIPWAFMQPPSKHDGPPVAPLLIAGALAGALAGWGFHLILRLRVRIRESHPVAAEVAPYVTLGALSGFVLAMDVASILSPATLIGLGTTMEPQFLPLFVLEVAIVGSWAGTVLALILKLALTLLVPASTRPA